MTIRRAESGDLATVATLTERAYAQYTASFGAPPIPVTEDYAPRLAAGEVWLLEDESGLAGLIVLAKTERSLEIFSVAVAPERQGEGHGLALLRFAEAQAREQGCAVLSLYTNAMMTRNIALYQRFGFAETGRRENPLRPGWIRVDMEKPLTVAVGRRTA